MAWRHAMQRVDTLGDLLGMELFLLAYFYRVVVQQERTSR